MEILVWITAIGAVFMAWTALRKIKALQDEVTWLRHRMTLTPEERTEQDKAATKVRPAATRPPAQSGPWQSKTTPATDTDADTDAPGAPLGKKIIRPVMDAPNAEPLPAVGPSWGARAVTWITGNWIAVAAAASLALAGVYLVIYGIENALLTPQMRVTLSTIMGFALIGGGEVLRRKPSLAGDILPAILSGAGLVVIYGTVAAADALYGFLAPVVALALMVATALGALALGGRHRVFLTGFGLVGAAAAPWIVGGEAGSDWAMPVYYLLLSGIGLAVGWFRASPATALLGSALALGFGLVPVIFGSAQLPVLAFLTGLTATSWIAVLMHPGAPASLFTGARPEGAQVLARRAPGVVFGIVLFVLALVLLTLATAFQDLLILGLGALFALAFAGLALRTRLLRLQELGTLPLVAAIASVWLSVADFPQIVTYVHVGALLLAGALALHFALRAFVADGKPGWVFAGACVMGGGFAGLQLIAYPALCLGSFAWSGSLLAAAGLCTFCATWVAKSDPGRKAVGLLVITAIGLIALALTVTLDDAALTLALSVVLVVACALDLRLRLAFVKQAAALTVGGLLARLLVWPGFDWAWQAPWSQVALAFTTTLGAFALVVLMNRDGTRATLRNTALTGLGILLPATFALFLLRWQNGDSGLFMPSHWSAALIALATAASGLSLASGAAGTGIGAKLRTLAGLSLVALGALGTTAAATTGSPLFNRAEPVIGPVILNTLLLVYLIPGLMYLAAALRAPILRRPDAKPLRAVVGGFGTVLSVVWLFAAVRQAWNGADIAGGVVLPAEQTSYTVLMVLLGVTAIFASLKVPSDLRNLVRRLGLGIIGLTVLKAIFVDAGDLEGLARVLSFLILGLVLAGLAWAEQKLAKSED